MEDRARRSTGVSLAATFIAAVFGISGQLWALVLCLLTAVASLLYGFYPQLRRLIHAARRQGDEPLILRLRIVDLPTPDELRGVDKLAVAFAEPKFGVVEVKNDGPRNIMGLIPEVFIDGREMTDMGAWTTERGGTFETVGIDGVQLNVGAKRLLVIAVAFPAKGRSDDRNWYPVRAGMETKYYFNQVRQFGKNRTLGGTADVEVRFRAEGVDQAINLRLVFRADRSPGLQARPGTTNIVGHG